MRNTLLAATAAACLVVAAPRPASAQGMATFDSTQALGVIKQLKATADQWATMKSQLTDMDSQLLTQQTLLSAVQHGNAVMSIARGLMNPTAQMPGANAGAVPGMSFGAGLQGQGQRFYDQNHVFTPTGNDFAAQEMERRQEATANMQGEIQTGMETADGRVAMINEMMDNIQDNDDPTYLSAAQAHIQAEQAFLANEQTKIARLQVAQASMDRVDQQRAEQHARQEAEEMHAAAVAAAGW